MIPSLIAKVSPERLRHALFYLSKDPLPFREVNDDDGMFIKAGFPRTVMNIGSFPYQDSQYHLEGDVPERVNLDNLRRSAQVVLAAVLEIDEQD